VTIIYKCKLIAIIYKHVYIKRKHIYMHQSYLKHTCTYTSVIKNAKLIEARIKLIMFTILNVMK
jgi:hypothetical protein